MHLLILKFEIFITWMIHTVSSNFIKFEYEELLKDLHNRGGHEIPIGSLGNNTTKNPIHQYIPVGENEPAGTTYSTIYPTVQSPSSTFYPYPYPVQAPVHETEPTGGTVFPILIPHPIDTQQTIQKDLRALERRVDRLESLNELWKENFQTMRENFRRLLKRVNEWRFGKQS